MSKSNAFVKLMKWWERAEAATTREEAQKAIKKVEKFQRKLTEEDDQ